MMQLNDYQKKISLMWLIQKTRVQALIPIESHLEGVDS